MFQVYPCFSTSEQLRPDHTQEEVASEKSRRKHINYKIDVIEINEVVLFKV